MSKRSDAILELMRERGEKISRADLARIEDDLMAMPPEEAIDAQLWIYEGLSLIVSAPEYKGDIKLTDLD